MRIGRKILNNSNHRLTKKFLTWCFISVILMASFCVIFTSAAPSTESGLSVSVPDTPISEGEPYSYEVTVPDGIIYGSLIKYEWDWNHIPGEFNTEDEYETTDRSWTMSHTYYDDGEYNIGVRITSGQEETFASNTVIVTDSIPIVYVTILDDGPYYIDTEYRFDASGSLSGSDEIIEYLWDWDYSDSDGQDSFETIESTGQNSMATHSFTEPGEYQVAVKIIDDDGSYDINFVDCFVENPSYPKITEINPPDGSIIDIAIPTIQAKYEATASPIDIDNVILKLDEMTIDNPVITETEVIFTPYNEIGYGSHIVTVEVPDINGGYVLKKWSFTIVDPNDIHEQTTGEIPAGDEVTIIPDSQDTCIVNLDIKPSTYLENTRISITNLIEPPPEIPEPATENDVTYQHLDIRFTSNDIYVPDQDLDSTFIKFKVKKSWLNENDIDIGKIRLIRYHNNRWNELPTKVFEDGNLDICFESETPGFSTFAVVGSKIVEVPEPYKIKTPDVPLLPLIGITTAIMIILIVVLIKARYIYSGEEQPSKDTKKKERK